VLCPGQIFTLFETKDRIACAHLFSPAPALAVLALGLSLAGCSKPAPQESPTRRRAWMRRPKTPRHHADRCHGATAGRGGQPWRCLFHPGPGSGPARQLVAVHVDGAGRAEMHESKMQDGMMAMEPLKAVPLESGKSVEFKPGGNHVMLFDLAPTLKAGGVTELTITLDNGDKATTKAKVVGPGGAAAGDAHDMGHMDHM
jgi:hypothetical protein